MSEKTSVKGVIDRFEGNFAVILNDEGESLLELPRSILPAEAAEGSLIEMKIVVKKNKTLEAGRKAAELIEKLKHRAL